MRLSFAFALAAVCAMTLAPSTNAEAQSSRAKLQRAENAKSKPAVRRSAVVAARRNVGNGSSGLPDRTTINHPNGRINGQALFDSIAERTSGAGE